MKRWRASRDPFVFVCVIGAIIGVGLAIAAALHVIGDVQGLPEDWPITIRTFGWGLATVVGLVASGMLLRQAIQRGSLVYMLDRNGIYITQFGSRYTIPLDQVVAVTNGEQARSSSKASITFGRGQPAHQLIVETYQYAYSLALAEREQFGRELQERRQLGAIQSLLEGETRSHQTLYNFLTAATTRRLLVTTLLINLVLWGLLTWRFPALPATIPVRFDPLGGTAGTRAKNYTLLLPTIATVTWIGNLLLATLSYERSRLVSELLLLGALIVQIVLLLAVAFIITVAVSPA